MSRNVDLVCCTHRPLDSPEGTMQRVLITCTCTYLSNGEGFWEGRGVGRGGGVGWGGVLDEEGVLDGF